MIHPERLSGAVTLYEGDCLDVLPTLTGVDAVVTDPPYNVGLDYKLHDDSMPDDEYEEWCKRWFRELKRVCGGPILLTPGTGNVGLWNGIEKPKWMLCWWKPASSSRCPVGFCNWEPILLYGQGYSKKTCDVVRTTDQAALPVNHKKYPIDHPCPKSIEWACTLINSVCPDKDLILDPFAGSGTVGVAAILEGRRAILIEKDPHYCDIIRRRIADAEATGPQSLFKNVKHPELFTKVHS